MLQETPTDRKEPIETPSATVPVRRARQPQSTQKDGAASLDEAAAREAALLLAEGMINGRRDRTPSLSTLRTEAIRAFFSVLIGCCSERTVPPQIAPWRVRVADALDVGGDFTDGDALRVLERTPFGSLEGEEGSRASSPVSSGGMGSNGPLAVRVGCGVSPRFLLAALDRLSREAGPLGTREWTDFRRIMPRDLGCLYEAFSPWELAWKKDGLDSFGGTLIWRENDKARKASGSYYTPEHITAHIIRSALTPLLEGVPRPMLLDFNVGLKTLPSGKNSFQWPRVLDSAMGCGYFLLEAAEYLYRWACEDDTWHDATEPDLHSLRKSIVENALYGVDKDPIAVSLSLSALTGWAEGRLSASRSPALEAHLQVGNALIGRTPGNTGKSRSESGEMGANLGSTSFDWPAQFPEVFNNSSDAGFDAVVGNPPYDNSRGGLDTNPELAAVARHARAGGEYRVKGAVDLYRLFLQRSLRLCCTGGVLSMIVPRTLLGDRDASVDREILARETEILSIDDFPHDDAARRVFPSASMAACIVTCRKGAPATAFPVRRWTHGDMRQGHQRREVRLTELERFWPNYLPYVALGEREWEILAKLYASPWLCSLSEIADGGIGEVNSGYHKAFMVGEDTGALLLRGTDVSPYHVRTNGTTHKRWIDREGFLTALNEGARANLKSDRVRVVKQAVRNVALPKRLVAGLAGPGQFLADSTDFFLPKSPYDPRYVLALLNSRTVMEWLFRLVSTNNNVNLYQVRHLPVPRFRFGPPGDRAREGMAAARNLVAANPQGNTSGESALRQHLSEWDEWLDNWLNPEENDECGAPQAAHDLLVGLVTEMTDVRRKQREEIPILDENAVLDDRIKTLERLIDATLWKLYGLSHEEVRLVTASLDQL